MKKLSMILLFTLFNPVIAVADIDRWYPLFSNLDLNNDGVLTRTELLAKPDLIRFSNFYSQGSFFHADINKDNQIDFNEFTAQQEDLPN